VHASLEGDVITIRAFVDARTIRVFQRGADADTLASSDAHIEAPALIVVGNVVTLRDAIALERSEP
jgi:siroheme synthase